MGLFRPTSPCSRHAPRAAEPWALGGSVAGRRQVARGDRHEEFPRATWSIVTNPAAYFEKVRDEGWWPAYRYFLVVAVVLSILSPLAWASGVDGGSPLNTSTTAQRDVYRWWHDTLRPTIGLTSLPVAMLVLLLDMHIVLVVFTPILHVVFRLLGGKGPWSSSWKSIAYGMAPGLAFGFAPYVGLMVGVYATVLQLCVGPSTMYRLRDGRAYVPPMEPR